MSTLTPVVRCCGGQPVFMSKTDNIHLPPVSELPVVNKELAETAVSITAVITHPLKEKLMAVRVSDWDRLKLLLDRVENPPSDFSARWSLFLGVSATCVASAIPLWHSPDTRTVAWFFWGAATLFGVLAGFFLVAGRARSTKIAQDVRDVQREIRNIDAALETTPQPQGPAPIE